MQSFIVDFFQGGTLASLAGEYTWSWPIAEIFHFMGVTVLVGSIGLLDLRMLGMVKGLSPTAVHRLVPIGILGFGVCLATGLFFFAAEASMFANNELFYLKTLIILFAGANAAAFYLTPLRRAAALGPNDDAPFGAKAIAAVSLLLWMVVLFLGRFMAFI